jgi:integrase
MSAGHIRRRGKQSWELKFDVGIDPLTGKRRIRYASFKGTKRAAEIELARLIAQNAAGEGVDPSKATTAEFLNRWERDWASLNVSPKTFERYSELLRRHVVPHIGHAPIQKLRPAALAELYAKLTRAGLAARTVGHVHRCLHRALGHAVQWSVVAQNAAAHVSPPPVQSEEAQSLQSDDVRVLLDKLQTRRGRLLYTVALVLLGTGMRRGELLALRWEDLVDGGKLKIERSLEQTRQHGLRFKSPKTRHGRRTIALPASIVAELHAHRKAQQEHRLKLGQGRVPDDALIFANWDGEIRNPDALTKEWAACMKQNGMPQIKLHSLRHTHASQLIASGMDTITVSRRLGHGGPAITLSVYGHMFSNTDDRAAEIMETALSRNVTGVVTKPEGPLTWVGVP